MNNPTTIQQPVAAHSHPVTEPTSIRVGAMYYSSATATAPEVVWLSQQGNKTRPTLTVELRGTEIDAHLSKGLAALLRSQPGVRLDGGQWGFKVPEGYLVKDEYGKPRVQSDGTTITFLTKRFAKEFISRNPMSGTIDAEGNLTPANAAPADAGQLNADEALALGAEPTTAG